MLDLLRSTGKRKNHQKGIAREDKARKRAEAEQRQLAYSLLTREEKIAKLDLGGFKAVKQRAKLG